MKVEVEEEARVVIAGALIGALLGALGALLYFRQKRSGPALGGEAVLKGKRELPLPRLASLSLAAIRLIREIIKLASGG